MGGAGRTNAIKVRGSMYSSCEAEVSDERGKPMGKGLRKKAETNHMAFSHSDNDKNFPGPGCRSPLDGQDKRMQTCREAAFYGSAKSMVCHFEFIAH